MSYISVPTYDYQTDIWSHTEFDQRADFREFLWTMWKEPGKYEFDESSEKFYEEGVRFRRDGLYIIAPPQSKDYASYWDDQKDKCRNGVIFHNRDKTWYLPREYYMWLNFLPIYDKEEGKFGFAKLRDAQYHMALYEKIAEVSHKHAAILKKRQIASSYYHAAKMINLFFFEEGSVSKMAGSLKDYVNEKGTWRFLEEYRNFLNSHTAWYRPCNPDKVLNWEQKIEINTGGRKRDVGLKSVIAGTVLDKDPTNGVGGPCHDPETEILMSDVTLKKVKDIVIGDNVMGADGSPRTVRKLFKGTAQMYKVSQSKGVSYVVTGNHKLYVWDTYHKVYKTITAEEFTRLTPNAKRLLRGVKYEGRISEKLKHKSTLKVEPADIGLYNGFECDDHLYALKDGTVTHNCTFFFHEEAGIAPKMNVTLEYLLPAMKSGMMYTGMFAVAGSVGDLDACEPLKQMIMNPDSKDVLAVHTNLLDFENNTGMCGLFIPEQWSMLPCIDDYGNSQVEEALEMIRVERLDWKDKLSSEDYRLRISQKPTNIKEAFDYRKDSKFPQHLITRQMRRIEDKEYFIEYVDLKRNEKNEIEFKSTNKTPIMEFPISPRSTDKEGVVVIYERPIKDAPFLTYFASIDPVSEGKAESVDNMIFTPNGQSRIGDIKKGDFVTGSNGKPTLVKDVFPQGKKDLYRITFNDGFSVLACDEHLWNVKKGDGDRNGWHTLSVKQMLDPKGSIKFKGEGFNKAKEYKASTYFKNANGSSKWKIPIVEPIEFAKSYEPSVDPYLLGMLLGDGGLTTRAIRFTTADPEIIDYISEVLPENVTVKPVPSVTGYEYRISTSKSRNELTQQLRELGVMGKGSHDKFIPEDYITLPVNDRLQLLRGLMDADGSCTNHGAEFYSVSKALAEGVVRLTQSLGGISKIRKKNISNTSKVVGCGHVYVVRVILPASRNPFRLIRKKELYYEPYRMSRYIQSIEYEKTDDAVCISVDAADNLYVTEHAIVTHNTTTSESLCSIFVYKNNREVTVNKMDGSIESYTERGKLVASWCGRFDDLNKTHERLELLIEAYNAWTVVENNIHLFIQYMIQKKKQKYLVPKSQIMFLKELGSNMNVFQEYGWKNTGTMFKTNLISYCVQFLEEEIDVETEANGDIKNVTFGIERIPDIMLLKEMQAYHEKLNVDRLVAFCALVAFVRVQESNRGFAKAVENESGEDLHFSNKSSKLFMSPFKTIGRGKKMSDPMAKPRNAFKNFR